MRADNGVKRVVLVVGGRRLSPEVHILCRAGCLARWSRCRRVGWNNVIQTTAMEIISKDDWNNWNNVLGAQRRWTGTICLTHGVDANICSVQ
jgi:hypothetical protein